MTDEKKPTTPPHNRGTTEEKMIAVDVRGKDSSLWEKREPRFTERLLNSFKKLLGADIKPDITANEELLDAADTLAKSALEVIRKPQLRNLERQASIQLKLAEAKEKEANARKVNLEADKLEIDLEIAREQIHISQAIIDLKIQRGELIPIIKDGELTLIYKKRVLS